MSDFAITITCRLNEEDTQLTTLILDTVRDNSINLRSTITTHPMVNGDIVADHMYNNPSNENISGTFSLNGSKSNIISDSSSALSDVQEMFEKIKREGILCDIVKIHKVKNEDGKIQPRFKTRRNMVLDQISWIERINSLDFTFNFTEVLMVDVVEPVPDKNDLFLPNILEPNVLSFTDTLIDWNQVDVALIQAMRDADLITDDFLNFVNTTGAGLAVGVGAGIAAVILLGSNPVGWIAAGALAIGGLVYGAIQAIEADKRRKEYRVEQFKLYDDDKKNKKEVERFNNFIGEIHKHLELLNDSLKVYKVSSNEEQECVLTITNNYYVFNFLKNNINDSYSLTVKNIDEKVVGNCENITSAALVDISQCTINNTLFRAAESGAYVYIICPSENSIDRKDLTNYFIFASEINMEEYGNILQDIIINALKR